MKWLENKFYIFSSSHGRQSISKYIAADMSQSKYGGKKIVQRNTEESLSTATPNEHMQNRLCFLNCLAFAECFYLSIDYYFLDRKLNGVESRRNLMVAV